ncbi:zinc finger protein RFP-like [Tiliqua scincoides]|uniref:zinc finger protein RFP-like n=1 Tax=Tiliqua scincoides TaxID=71010 RepID=UPI0034625DCC
MAAAAGSLVKEFSDETTCPVCLEYFTDPVTTDCGHNFCRACLAKCQGEPDGSVSCPECREIIQERNFRPNRKLANIVEITKKFSLQVAKGTEGAGGVCKRHQEPLKLFCRDHEALICVVCDQSKEHREHRVIPVDEAAEEYKEKIQAHLQSLEEEREKLVKQRVSEEQRNQECLKQVGAEKQAITSVFKEMHKYLQEKENFCLNQLVDLEKEIKKRQHENMTRLSQKISHFSKLIKDVEVKYRQPPGKFLQDIRCTLSRCQEEKVRTRLVLSPGLEWRLGSDSMKSSVLKKAMQEFKGSLKRELSKGSPMQSVNKGNTQQGKKGDGKKVEKCKVLDSLGMRQKCSLPQKQTWNKSYYLQVSVTLDSGTLHPQLILSEDLKSVKCGASQRKLPGNPERFDLVPCVLGQESFTSGRHCWEVELEKLKGRGWAVGVAQETLRRKGGFIISPNVGIWAVGEEPSLPHPFLALMSPERIPLTFRCVPRKIRVALDYEEGRVEFFDADTDNWMFAFPPTSFSGKKIRPFFKVVAGITLKCVS